MDKWADYAIVAVRYDDSHSGIVNVKRRTDSGNKLVNETIKTRTDIVNSILNGESYVTARKGADNKWQKGDDVIVVNRHGANFIQTAGNETAVDNLGELPEF